MGCYSYVEMEFLWIKYLLFVKDKRCEKNYLDQIILFER